MSFKSSAESAIEDCDFGIARLVRLFDPGHVDIGCITVPKECCEPPTAHFAKLSTQSVALIRTKFANLRFYDDGSVSLTDFLITFNGLVLDLKQAGHPLSNAEICFRLAFAMPLSLQFIVSVLQEGRNSENPIHWYQVLSTTWERLRVIRTDEKTPAAKRTTTITTYTSLPQGCSPCNKPGHYPRDCPSLSPEERAHRQEKARERNERRSTGSRLNGEVSDLASQLAQIQARPAAIEARSLYTSETSSGYGTHVKVTILYASTSALSENAQLESPTHDDSEGLMPQAGKMPSSYATISSGVSRHCAPERAFFINYRILPEPKRMYLGDNRFIMAIGEGDLRLWVDGPSGEREGIIFQHTLYAPDLACTLISIRQLTRDSRLAVHAIFRGSICEIRNNTGTQG